MTQQPNRETNVERVEGDVVVPDTTSAPEPDEPDTHDEPDEDDDADERDER